MSWLDTHKDAKEIQTIEELKKYKGEKIYYKELDQIGIVDRVKDDGVFTYIPLVQCTEADGMPVNIGSLDSLEVGVLAEGVFEPYYNEKETECFEEARKRKEEKGEEVDHYETGYFGETYPVYKS